MERISNQVVASAQEGNASMQYQLANYLYMGDETKDPNPEQGYQWMLAAAENGSVKAQKVLGLLYTNGQHSPYPAQNLEEAVYWYERAARAGDGEAMYWLYCCYNKGIGVVYDSSIARYWRDQAISHGYEIEEDTPAPATASTGPKPWEQYDLEEEPSNRSSVRSASGRRGRGRSSRGNSRSRQASGRTERSLREESLDKAQDGVLFIPKNDMSYVKSALTSGIVALSVSIIAFCILALIINAVNKSFFASGKRGTFLIIAALVSLAIGAWQFRKAYLAAYEDAKQNAWFRKTAFYKQYKVDYDKLSVPGRMQYEYYASLEKSFHPCASTDVLPGNLFREERGYMFLGLYYGERGACAVPDFTIVTEKAVYVVQCLKLNGRLTGDTRDDALQHRTPSGRVHRIPNPIRQNEQRLRIMEKDIGRICPWAVTEAMSFQSIVVAGSDLDLSQLAGERRAQNSHLLQVSPEELRSQIEVMESKRTLQEKEATELIGAMEQIAQEYERRKTAFGREML